MDAVMHMYVYSNPNQLKCVPVNHTHAQKGQIRPSPSTKASYSRARSPFTTDPHTYVRRDHTAAEPSVRACVHGGQFWGLSLWLGSVDGGMGSREREKED